MPSTANNRGIGDYWHFSRNAPGGGYFSNLSPQQEIANNNAAREQRQSGGTFMDALKSAAKTVVGNLPVVGQAAGSLISYYEAEKANDIAKDAVKTQYASDAAALAQQKSYYDEQLKKQQEALNQAAAAVKAADDKAAKDKSDANAANLAALNDDIDRRKRRTGMQSLIRSTALGSGTDALAARAQLLGNA